ncbi:hypothetical protein PFICI_14459 [Pestalotiopsis fici W106-1]|uniref:Alternative oxidase n=1 Tax=Pestalotiopsis fici (strain W106-1 / CGMCC3.15140) TaxID=1229662 RepID=W3WHZ1_PESFW|nr:uncharacterized protein PFICI_14459 [Pestalotiopsis fici W106-1]ETS73513.1 hypothetical protein PFICI_14459 [Pestalotiopsis fici W106-1]
MLCPERPGLLFFLVSCFIIVWGFRIFVFDIPDAVASIFHGTPDRLEVEREFVQQAMSVEFPAPIDYEPIRQVCARTQFRPGLVFSCEGQHGGIGMVRNQILKCVRYAIHGGGALVIPSMALRNAKNLADIETSTEVPLDYLLDRDTFVSHLSKGCPGMQLYDHADDFPSYQHRTGEPLHILGDQFEPDHPREGLRHPRQWREFFDNWLEEKSVKVSANAPVHVKFEQSFLEYPVQDDGEAFVNEFGKILSYRNDTRALAAKVLFEMKRRFTLPIDPKTAINPGTYYGAHLRLESDAIWAWPPAQWRFSRMDEQFEQQFQNLERSGLGVVYVASGNQTVVDMFAEAWGKRITANPGSGRRNVTVVTKHDLLRGHDRQRLEGMTFDQQALVDFMVMFKASAFMGVAHSSFPWTVALRRHELSKYTSYANEGSDLLRDEYSVIMGMQADYPEIDPFVTGIWP